MTAATQNLIAFIFLLGLTAQCVHQLLPDRDDQLALSDEDLGGLAVAEAAGKHTDGFEKCPEIEPAVLRQVGLPVGALPTGTRGKRGRTLEKRKEKMDKGWNQQRIVFPLQSWLNLQEPLLEKSDLLRKCRAGCDICLTNECQCLLAFFCFVLSRQDFSV